MVMSRVSGRMNHLKLGWLAQRFMRPGRPKRPIGSNGPRGYPTESPKIGRKVSLLSDLWALERYRTTERAARSALR